MIRDSKAEELEAKGLYRRAAARWAEVMQLVNTDKEREQVAKRRAECIRRAARPPVMADICAKMTGSAGDSPGGGFATILFISRHHADLYSAGCSVAHPRIFNYALR